MPANPAQVDPAPDEGSTPEPSTTDPVGAPVAANEQFPGPGDKDPEPLTTTTPAEPTPTPILSGAAPESGTTAATPPLLEPAASAPPPEQQPVAATQAPEEMASLSAEPAPPPIPDSGKDQVPSATASPTQSGVSKLADRLASSFEELFGIPPKELADGLVGWTADVADGVARTVDRVLSALLGGGAGPPAGSSPFGDSPMAPVPAVPAAPVAPSPVGGPSFGGSGTSHSDSELMLAEFAILILSSVFILQSGKLMRLSGEVFKPGSVFQLAIERPG